MTTTATDPAASRVEEACRIMDAADTVVPLAALAAEVRAAPDTLRRDFQRLLGVTPRQYADTLRRERLRSALRAGRDVTSALFGSGYGSTSRLYESAHAHLGMTPASYRAGGAGATIRWTITSSTLGRLLVAATDRGLCRVALADDDATLEADLAHEFPRAVRSRDDDGLRTLVDDVLALCDGEEPAHDIPLDVRGTAFQRKVWEALTRIPRGEVRTYAEVAAAIGEPRAVRAVGSACGANPIAIVVPCHRVVPKSGGVGSYGWGPDRKRQLLRNEGAEVADP